MLVQIARLAALTALGCASAGAAELLVTVTDIREPQGSILAALFDSAETWNNQGKPLAAQKVAASGSEITLRFDDLPAGSYAVQVMHDENDNGKLDTNFLGIPVEGYGFSNNPREMRRARYEEARFELGEEGAAIVIRLR